MTVQDLKKLITGLTAQTEREALSTFLNDLFSTAKEINDIQAIEIKQMNTTDEREVFYEKMNANFRAFFPADVETSHLPYISPTMGQSTRIFLIKLYMQAIFGING
jgi:hypothetical protein